MLHVFQFTDDLNNFSNSLFKQCLHNVNNSITMYWKLDLGKVRITELQVHYTLRMFCLLNLELRYFDGTYLKYEDLPDTKLHNCYGVEYM